MTPLLSWLLFGACIVVGFIVYAAVVVGGRADREWQRIRWERRNGGGVVHFAPGTSLDEVRSFVDVFESHIRVHGGIYDWQARGDFDR